MDQLRFDKANELWRAGHQEKAARLFHAMAEEADYADEKAAALINEHKCYCQIARYDKAQKVMHEIRGLAVQDKFVRMVVDIVTPA